MNISINTICNWIAISIKNRLLQYTLYTPPFHPTPHPSRKGLRFYFMKNTFQRTLTLTNYNLHYEVGFILGILRIEINYYNSMYLLHGRACDIAELLHECGLMHSYINPHKCNNSAMLHVIPCNKYFVILRATLRQFAQDLFWKSEWM